MLLPPDPHGPITRCSCLIDACHGCKQVGCWRLRQAWSGHGVSLSRICLQHSQLRSGLRLCGLSSQTALATRQYLELMIGLHMVSRRYILRQKCPGKCLLCQSSTPFCLITFLALGFTCATKRSFSKIHVARNTIYKILSAAQIPYRQ